jgi:hypothetical protein
VRFLQNKLLLIGSGKWPEKIESVIAGQDVNLDIVRIPAREFLHLDSRSVKKLLDNRLVWIATIPGNQIQILYSLKEFENKVIIEKPFALNLNELDSILAYSRSSKNKLYVSEPWRHSHKWKIKKLEIEATSGEKKISINRGSPETREYITPAWDWLQHDIGLLSDLLSSNRNSIDILSELNNDQSNLLLKLKTEDFYTIELNVGFFPQRQETWHLNNELLIDFAVASTLIDHPLYNMFRFVSDEKFISDLETQIWLLSRVIKCLEND